MILNFLRHIDLSPSILTMWVCVLVGAFILNNFTRFTGALGFVVNGLALYGGAQAANYLAAGLDVPLTFTTQKTLLVTISGMLIASLLMLLLFSRPARN